MGAAARSRPLHAKYAFTVHDLSGGIREAKFQKATGAEITFAIGEYTEGGAIAPMKESTRQSFSNVTLEHGVFENEELYDWVLEAGDVMAHVPEGLGVDSPDHLRNFEIRQLRRSRSVLMSVRLHNAQPARFKPGEFDNTSDDIQVEELELAYEYFTKKLGW